MNIYRTCEIYDIAESDLAESDIAESDLGEFDCCFTTYCSSLNLPTFMKGLAFYKMGLRKYFSLFAFPVQQNLLK